MARWCHCGEQRREVLEPIRNFAEAPWCRMITSWLDGPKPRRRSTLRQILIPMPRHQLPVSLAPTGRSAARTERVLAVGRAFLTVTGLIAIYLDPTEPARLREVTYSVLLAYAVYSLAVLAYVNGTARLTPVHGRVLHGLDIFWTAALTFVSEGPVSPFYLFFLFVVLAAANRWGFRETAGTAVITIAVFLIETAVASAGPWKETWFASIEFELTSVYRQAYDGHVLTIGLAKAPSETCVLQAVDIPLVVRSADVDAARLAQKVPTARLIDAGPRGWSEAILEHLDGRVGR